MPRRTRLKRSKYKEMLREKEYVAYVEKQKRLFDAGKISKSELKKRLR